MLELLKNKKIMIIVAHPDDELLGLGATMNLLITEYKVITHVVILGEGVTSRSENRDTEAWKGQLINHKKNILEAQRIIGYHSVNIYDFPDNRFDTVALLDIIKIVEKEKADFQPDVIFTHHGGDVNIDHQRTFEAVITSCRPMQEEIVKTIVTFETMSGTEWRASTDPKHFVPNFFISFSKHNLDIKIDAMNAYIYEKRQYPHPRSAEALEIVAKRWGVSVGKNYAEAFCLVRNISN
jgi:LmbE family N-acetylglucosaminyl deacetylase